MADANGWMPIETAPRDGTWVLLWDCLEPCFYHFRIAQYVPSKRPECEEWENWIKTDECYAGDQITHWQPLPGPPEPAA